MYIHKYVIIYVYVYIYIYIYTHKIKGLLPFGVEPGRVPIG